MNYEFKPRYYDERKEYVRELESRYKDREEPESQEAIKLRLQSSFQRRFDEQRKGITYSSRQSGIRVFVIFIILSSFTIYFILKFLPKLSALLN